MNRINTQAQWIAGAYKVIGLYAIPLLTAVTVISMTNVFSAGTFVHWPYVSTIWAFIFALAIDVNIVRLFVEAKTDKSKMAFIVGLGLCIVTGAALFIEGLQQSIGIAWSDEKIQTAVGILVGCRVILVIVLMAREGLKLGEVCMAFDLQVALKSTVNAPQIETQTETESDLKLAQIEVELHDEMTCKSEVTTGPIIAVARITTPLAPLPLYEQFAYPDSPVIQHPEPFHHADYTYTEHKQASGVVTRETVVNEPETIPVSMPISVEQITEESKSLKQPSHPQNRYTAKEAARLEICKSTGVKSGEITKAIASGELTANREGLFSKTALENWLKSRRKVAA